MHDAMYFYCLRMRFLKPHPHQIYEIEFRVWTPKLPNAGKGCEFLYLWLIGLSEAHVLLRQ
jgi:hypothetical protein